jgi:hypothetical protein
MSLHRLVGSRAQLAVIAVLGVVAGCTDAPTAPGGLGSEAGGGSSIESNWETEQPEWMVSQRVGTRGGYMLLDGKDVLLSFPHRAVVGNRTFTVWMKLDAVRGQATRLEYSLESSARLRSPLQLTVQPDYLAGAGDTVKLLSFDAVANVWESREERSIASGQPAVFAISGPGVYAISR